MLDASALENNAQIYKVNSENFTNSLNFNGYSINDFQANHEGV